MSVVITLVLYDYFFKGALNFKMLSLSSSNSSSTSLSFWFT